MAKRHIQMIDNNYYILQTFNAQERYPHLFNEIQTHDKISTSSWYDLSEEAFEEYVQWRKNEGK